MKRRHLRKGIICKECPQCHKILPESEYNLKSQAPDKLQSYCKECNKEYCRIWRHEHKLS